MHYTVQWYRPAQTCLVYERVFTMHITDMTWKRDGAKSVSWLPRWIRIPSEMNSYSIWDDFVFHLRWFRIPSEMTSYSIWDDFVFHLRWICIPSEMISYSIWDEFVFHLRWFRIPSEMNSYSIWDDFVFHLRWIRIPSEMNSYSIVWWMCGSSISCFRFPIFALAPS
jgi:hypothetical protein